MSSVSPRRDVVVTLAKTFAAVGAGVGVYALFRGSAGLVTSHSRPTMSVPLDEIAVGTSKVINWQGTPILVRHRSIAEMDQARAGDPALFRDAQSRDETAAGARTTIGAHRGLLGRPAWIMLVGVCTKLDCSVREIDGDLRLRDGIGWICPCCAARYDLAGRVISGPAPQNLRVPRHELRGSEVALY